MRSDAFGCVRKQMEGFGKIVCLRLVLMFSDDFEAFIWSVSNVMSSLYKVLDVLEDFHYLISLVIYREPPLWWARPSNLTAGLHG